MKIYYISPEKKAEFRDFNRFARYIAKSRLEKFLKKTKEAKQFYELDGYNPTLFLETLHKGLVFEEANQRMRYFGKEMLKINSLIYEEKNPKRFLIGIDLELISKSEEEWAKQICQDKGFEYRKWRKNYGSILKQLNFKLNDFYIPEQILKIIPRYINFHNKHQYDDFLNATKGLIDIASKSKANYNRVKKGLNVLRGE